MNIFQKNTSEMTSIHPFHLILKTNTKIIIFTSQGSHDTEGEHWCTEGETVVYRGGREFDILPDTGYRIFSLGTIGRIPDIRPW